MKNLHGYEYWNGVCTAVYTMTLWMIVKRDNNPGIRYMSLLELPTVDSCFGVLIVFVTSYKVQRTGFYSWVVCIKNTGRGTSVWVMRYKLRVNQTSYKSLPMNWAVYYMYHKNFHWTFQLNVSVYRGPNSNNKTTIIFILPSKTSRFNYIFNGYFQT